MEIVRGQQYSGLYNNQVVEIVRVVKGSKTFVTYKIINGIKTELTKTETQFRSLFKKVGT